MSSGVTKNLSRGVLKFLLVKTTHQKNKHIYQIYGHILLEYFENTIIKSDISEIKNNQCNMYTIYAHN